MTMEYINHEWKWEKNGMSIVCTKCGNRFDAHIIEDDGIRSFIIFLNGQKTDKKPFEIECEEKNDISNNR